VTLDVTRLSAIELDWMIAAVDELKAETMLTDEMWRLSEALDKEERRRVEGGVEVSYGARPAAPARGPLRLISGDNDRRAS
jgi:hypothetical protein